MVTASLADGLVGLGPVRGDGTPRWLASLARVGFAAKGFVYVLIAVFAAMAAFGSSVPTGSSGALGELRDEPLGFALLLLAAIGIAAYAAWRLASAVFNPERKGAIRRVGYVITVVIYAGLAVEAVRMAVGGATSGGSGDEAASHWTARLMAQPFGVILVALVGAGIALYGGYQIYKAWKSDVAKDLRLHTLRREPRKAVIATARAGLAARGIVFLVAGVFVVRAGLQADPSEARGTGGALRAIEQQPYGPYLLAAVALGLLAYGIYQFLRAKYQRVGAAH
jgi:Domain of Unknown Function (DUF1206)